MAWRGDAFTSLTSSLFSEDFFPVTGRVFARIRLDSTDPRSCARRACACPQSHWLTCGVRAQTGASARAGTRTAAASTAVRRATVPATAPGAWRHVVRCLRTPSQHALADLMARNLGYSVVSPATVVPERLAATRPPSRRARTMLRLRPLRTALRASARRRRAAGRGHHRARRRGRGPPGGTPLPRRTKRARKPATRRMRV